MSYRTLSAKTVSHRRSPDQSHVADGRTGHAIVIGASMAGLLAARVLCDHFAKVTLIERDRITAPPEKYTPSAVASRPGVPQGQHLHTLLVRGEQILSRLFPGLDQELAAAGATRIDLSNDMLWFQSGHYKTRFDSGLTVMFMSRPLLESAVRRRVRSRQNLTCIDQHTVKRLLSNDDNSRVTGVAIQKRDNSEKEQSLFADLVIDATGRTSKSPQWLESLGYQKPQESVVRVNVGYTTRIYKRDPALLPHAKGIFTSPNIPHSRRGGGLAPIEGNRWMATLVGWLGEHAPTTEQGFLDYAKSLATPDVYNVISRAEPLSGFSKHKLPSNLRRHYEKMTRFPLGYLVMGDAMCSFNPVYGQGMSVSAMEAEVLERCLQDVYSQQNSSQQNSSQQNNPLIEQHFWKDFFSLAAKAIDNPWTMAVGEDFRFPDVRGPKGLGTDFINQYISQVHRTTAHDADTTRAFFQVMTLLKPPQTLFHPGILLRVATNRLRYRHGSTRPSADTVSV